MSDTEKTGNWFKRHKIATGVLVFITIGIIGAAAGGGKQNSATTSTASTNTKSAKTVAATNTVSQSAAESYCQDAGLLGKYVDLKTTDIVTTSYSPQYIDSGMQATNGDKIQDLQWSGKNKSTGTSVSFVCMVSGTDKSVALHDLAIDGTAVYGPVGEKQ